MAGILFLCCDMGETNALIPIMHELQVKEVDFKILAMGAAINKLESDSSLKGKVTRVIEGVDTVNHRSKSLENVSEAIKDLNPLLVVSGAASQAQKQLVEALGVKSVIFLDNFNYATTNPSFDTVKEVASVGNKIICVTDIVKEQILPYVTIKNKRIKPFGPPSLDSFVKEVNQVKSQGYVTFIGGYGKHYDGGVNEAYASAKKALEEKNYHVHIQHHPNVMKEQPLTKVEAVGRADFVVCYDSTLGFESLFAGKKVIYLQPEGVEPYDNIALEKGLATRVKNNEELLNALKDTSHEKIDPYEVLGVAKNSTEVITNYIKNKVHGRK